MRPELELPTEEELVASAEGQTPETPTETPAAEPEKLLRIQLRNGKTYTGKTHEEIEQALAEDLERQHLDSTTRDTQTREMRGKVEYQQQAQFEQAKYLDLLGKDALEAQRYLDRFYLGIPEYEDPAAVQHHAYQVASRVHDSFEIAEFQRMNNGLTMSDADAATLLQTIDRENLVLTARNLNAVYHELKSTGRITDTPAPAAQEYQDIQLPRSRGAGAPRATGGGGSPAPTSQKSEADFEKMSYADLQALARKEGLLQH